MTIEAIRENLEHSRGAGIKYKIAEPPRRDIVIGAPTNGTVDMDGYTKVYPGAHEARLYSICEGLIVEIERLQKRVADLERENADLNRAVAPIRLIGGTQHFTTAPVNAMEAGIIGGISGD